MQPEVENNCTSTAIADIPAENCVKKGTYSIYVPHSLTQELQTLNLEYKQRVDDI